MGGAELQSESCSAPSSSKRCPMRKSHDRDHHTQRVALSQGPRGVAPSTHDNSVHVHSAVVAPVVGANHEYHLWLLQMIARFSVKRRYPIPH